MDAIEKQLKMKLDLAYLLNLEDDRWWQKSYIYWHKHSNKSTKFSQALARGKSRKNKIYDMDGGWSCIEIKFIHYLLHLLSKSL